MLDNYEPVSARLDRWLQANSGRETRVITDLVHYLQDVAVFRAELWLDGTLISTGWAEEIRGQGNVNRTSHVENAETSAVGRALANAGMAGSDYTKRPSREEMSKVQRMGGGQAAPEQKGITITNKIPGKCMRCFSPVEAGQGVATKENGKWVTYHKEGECNTEEPF